MTKRLALAATAAGGLLVLGASVWRFPGAEVLFLFAAAALPSLLMAIGASRGDRLGRIGALLATLFASLVLSLFAVLTLAGRLDTAPWIFGLPLAPLVLFLGVFLVPLVTVGLGFAFTFDRFGVAPHDLERLRGVTPERGDD